MKMIIKSKSNTNSRSTPSSRCNTGLGPSQDDRNRSNFTNDDPILSSDASMLESIDSVTNIHQNPHLYTAETDYDGESESGDDTLSESKSLDDDLLRMLTTRQDDYTILSRRERIALALLLSLIGVCSSMSMSIYWPALTELERDFHTTESKINYTITAYLCFQSVAPLFVSSLSDIFGRRPTMLLCILGGAVTNIGLAVSRTYWLIIFLRCVLATFCAPLMSITVASVGDYTTKRNRGGLVALTAGFTLVGQGVSPFLGAVMDTAWKWPAIFWFSAALQGTIFTIAFICLPETHRGFVGNMSVIPKNIIHRSPALIYLRKRLVSYDETLLEERRHKYEPWKALRLVLNLSVFYVLLPSSILFTIWNMCLTNLSVNLSKDYHLSSLKIGLCFFAPGAATLSGTLFAGKLLDVYYKKKKAIYDKEYADMIRRSHQHVHSDSHSEDNEKDIEKNEPEQMQPFNIIYVRLFFLPFAAGLTCCSAIAYGWCIGATVNLAPVLITSFLITFSCMFPLNIASTVLIDMYPEIAGGATALNNLFRCGMSAIFISCLDRMEDKMKIGGTYTFMGVLSLLFSSLFIVLIRKSQSIVNEAVAKHNNAVTDGAAKAVN